MAKLKTKPTQAGVESFLNAVPHSQRRADAFQMLEIMKEITGQGPKMWGPTIVGFGRYHYVYASGHEGESCLTGFSPRKDALTVYFTAGFQERFATELKKLGKARASKGCLYIKKLADIDLVVLREMIRTTVARLMAQWKLPTEPAPQKKKRKKQ